MASLAKWAQIKLILLLWGRVPVWTEMLTFYDDGMVRQRFLWAKPKDGILRFEKKKEALIACKGDLYFSSILWLIVVPVLAYREGLAYPEKVAGWKIRDALQTTHRT